MAPSAKKSRIEIAAQKVNEADEEYKIGNDKKAADLFEIAGAYLEEARKYEVEYDLSKELLRSKSNYCYNKAKKNSIMFETRD